MMTMMMTMTMTHVMMMMYGPNQKFMDSSLSLRTLYVLLVCFFVFLWGVEEWVVFFLVLVVLISFDFLSIYLFQVFILFTVFFWPSPVLATEERSL